MLFMHCVCTQLLCAVCLCSRTLMRHACACSTNTHHVHALHLRIACVLPFLFVRIMCSCAMRVRPPQIRTMFMHCIYALRVYYHFFLYASCVHAPCMCVLHKYAPCSCIASTHCVCIAVSFCTHRVFMRHACACSTNAHQVSCIASSHCVYAPFVFYALYDHPLFVESRCMPNLNLTYNGKAFLTACCVLASATAMAVVTQL